VWVGDDMGPQVELTARPTLYGDDRHDPGLTGQQYSTYSGWINHTTVFLTMIAVEIVLVPG